MGRSLVIRNIARAYTIDETNSCRPSVGTGPLTIHCEDGIIRGIDSDKKAPPCDIEIDGSGLIATPGLVDCHTHAVWAGSRADEFRRRLAGASYSEILESGGGILSTVAATRAATDSELEAFAIGRLQQCVGRGVTTMEIKSGYGLRAADELRILRAAKRAGQKVGIRVFTTFLGAHAIPQEYRARRESYVNNVIEEQLPVVVDDADFIDVYVDKGAFTVEEGRRILEAGQQLGLGIRVHAEQVAFTGAARMAAELGALSADHLERIDAQGIECMAKNGTVAVLLPGAMLYLRDSSPPVERLRAAGVPMAVATDLNPGSSPVNDLWACASLACITMGLTVDEALRGITKNGARALGQPDLGVLKVGGPADIALFRPLPGESAEIVPFIQHLSGPTAEYVLVGGEVIFDGR